MGERSPAAEGSGLKPSTLTPPLSIFLERSPAAEGSGLKPIHFTDQAATLSAHLPLKEAD